jgi:iturin family lipopeptide synthetase A
MNNMDKQPIAIIGIGCRFPGADNREAFWHLLREGIDAITEVPSERWDVNAFCQKDVEKPANIRWGGFIKDLDLFDPQFFKISPREAVSIDPQQRLLLELAWEALEDAGQNPESLSGTKTGVFMGINGFDYYTLLMENPSFNIDAYVGTGNTNCIAANRISYFFNFTGPSLGIDTACSSSLVAVHLACQSIWNGESNLALAGGVRIILSPWTGVSFDRAGFMASDGRCKAFDSRADGYVRSEGAGVVLIKPLSKALADGDPIYASIKGSAVNQDGRSNGLTAPNPWAQEEVLREACYQARVSPNRLQYIEAHGTGTQLGDPIEMKALGKVLAENRPPSNDCLVGSVKTNIGHLEAAAGIAGLIKVALSLHHHQIPPSLHFQQPNPYITFDNLPLRVPSALEAWPVTTDKEIAGVSSFSFGGTNAHIVLEAAPTVSRKKAVFESSLYLLTLSAKNEKALQDLARRYLEFLASHPTVSLSDVCFTASIGRSHFKHRLAIAAESNQQLMQRLNIFCQGQIPVGAVNGQHFRSKQQHKIAFLFTGQGSQYTNMGWQFYNTQPIFRKILDECNRLLQPYLEKSLLSILFADSQDAELLNQTAYTQPALFVLEYALAQMWQSWGIFPDIVMGHSLGEYVAACVAGVFSLEEGLKLVAERGRQMQTLPSIGMMVAVFTTQERVIDAILPYQRQVGIAAINGPEHIIISGEKKSVESIIKQLQAEGIQVRFLKVSHAFHSPLIDPFLDQFEQLANQIQYNHPRIPIVSNITGNILTEKESIDSVYWRLHASKAVQFAAGIQTLIDQEYHLFIEIGPHPVLSPMGKRCLETDNTTWLPSIQRGQDNWSVILNSLSKLYVNGMKIDWVSFYENCEGSKIHLPTYPFQRQSYWIKPKEIQSNHIHNTTNNSKNKTEKLLIQAQSTESINSSMIVSDLDTEKIQLNEDKTKATIVKNINMQSTKRESISSILISKIADLLQMDSSELNIYDSFLDMGADSISLLEAVRSIESTFGIKIEIRQLFEELQNIDSLISYLEQNLPSDWIGDKSSQTELDIKEKEKPPELEDSSQFSQSIFDQTNQLTTNNLPTKTYTNQAASQQNGKLMSETPLTEVVKQQLQLMSQQTELLHSELLHMGQSSGSTATPPEFEPIQSLSQSVEIPSESTNNFSPTQIAKDTSQNVTPNQLNSTNSQLTVKRSEPSNSNSSGSKGSLNSEQKNYLNTFIARYTKRTQGSKSLKQTYHSVLADKRASSGFRPALKEMIYPIAGKSSQGSRIWDVDSNEYVDISLGFGVHLFGHSAPFIMEAVEAQIKEGIQIGPQSRLAGEVAELFCELTNTERAAYCNTGTEAVMTAIRLARAVTGRAKIAFFSGSYHGQSDQTLFISRQTKNGQSFASPLAGVPECMAEDTLVLRYDDPESLDIIRANAGDLAAVLVEPVQSLCPELQPKKFLQDLRVLTAANNIILIFDEVITGFRLHLGGAQAWFDVEADIATYGKIVGGGMPIGIVAGKAKYMNAIDGGSWNYGDNSYPQAGTIYYGGTFNKNPLTTASALAVLKYLREQGSKLQQQLNLRTSQLAEKLNTFFEQENVPLQVLYCASLFRFTYLTSSKKFGDSLFANSNLELDLFYFHLIEQGVYASEARRFFLSTAHTDEDIDYIVWAVKKSVEQMRSGGFLYKNLPKTINEKQPESTTNISTRLSLANDFNLQAPISQPINTVHNLRKTKRKNSAQVNADAQQATGFWGRKNYKPALVSRDRTEVKAKRNKKSEISLSLFYFGNYESEFDPDKYNLLFKGAKFADKHGFAALWVPERHFHAFGGFSPNPSVIAAALARETEQIQIRAGSVVLPIHHPIRVAEEWSVVDNLSKGRVGISFASGWHSNDFVFAPESYGNHRELMFQEIETVQKLWQGKPIQFRDGSGRNIDVKLFPMPVQPDLPVWVTIVNNSKTYVKAGEIGANVLTNLMGQTIEDLEKNIALYRESLSQHGYNPELGHVTVLLHTFIGDELNIIREKAREPFYNYLRSGVGLFQNLVKSQGLKVNLETLSKNDIDYILSKAYERYVQTSALIGTPSSCLSIIDNLIAIGVDEIACFVDFGVDANSVVEGFHHLKSLKEHYQKQEDGVSEAVLLPEITAISSKLKVNSKVLHTVPLTEQQKQFWIIAQMGEESSSAYNESITLQLKGILNVTALERAFRQLIHRHESLRTIFSIKGDFQQILSSLTVELPLIDYSSLAFNERESKVAQCLKKENQQCFDFVQGPLFRAKILKLEEQMHLLVFTAHHIIIDDWSFGVLIEEMSMLYTAECQGKFCELQPPMQFREYMQWYTQQYQREQKSADESYWLSQFEHSIPVLELPTNRPRPSKQTFSGASWKGMTLDPSLRDALKRLSQKNGCTLFMTLLAGYFTLLHRFTKQDDIVVGIPVTVRPLKGGENLIGHCVNLVAVKSKIFAHLTFTEYLASIKNEVLEAYKHKDYPFGTLIQKLNPPRDASRSPLVTTLFNMDRPLKTVPKFFGLEIDLIPSPISHSKFEIYMSVFEVNDRLMMEIHYNSDLFDVSTIDRIAGNFQKLLENLVANPEQRLSSVALLTDAEYYTLVDQRNDIALYPSDKCIHSLFEEQVKRSSDSVAVVFKQQKLTYRQLNERANQLARHLQTLGVGAEVLVGICVERSLEMVVGLLGILKAGGAYVSLDPNYPTERLNYTLADGEIKVLLTQESLLSSFSSYPERVICLDTDWETIKQRSGHNLETNVGADNLAYVIYTSGSTGTPKGVTIEHKNVARLFAATQSWYQFNSNDVWTNFHSIAFDFSVWEIWGALFYGGRLVVVPHNVTRDPFAFYQLLCSERVTVLNQTPSAFTQLMAIEKRVDTPLKELSLRLVIFGGEVLELQNLKPWFSKHGDRHPQLVNMYGITETTVHVTYRPLTINDLSNSGSPIGRPLPDLQVYILDDNLQAVPIGVKGQMYVGGSGLARGYLNRQQLSWERFIPNLFDEGLGKRLYKTGDLARYLPNGEIEYLGRIDHQVKIRGFRIELGEIEAVLNSHFQIQQAVVLATKDTSENKRLVAYVVSEKETLSTHQLREFLQQQLPAYMIPSAFVVLDTLPLTLNGKIDRQALPDPDAVRPELQQAFVAPRDALEHQLTHIWQDVLGLQTIGVNDNFFDLGGHSLLALHLMGQINKQFAQNLPLTMLFQSPNIEQLANALRQLIVSQPWSPLVKIQPYGSKKPFFCLPGSGGYVMYLRHLARYFSPDRPFYGLQARGLDGVQTPHAKVEDMASDYIAAIQTIQPQGPYFLGGHSFGSFVAFEMALQLQKQGQEIALLAIFDTPAPIFGNQPVKREQDDVQYLIEIAAMVENYIGKNLSLSYDTLKSLKPNEQLNYLLERMKVVNFFPPEFGSEQLSGLLQVLKANNQTQYVPQSIYSNRIVLFRANEEFRDELTMGWEQFCSKFIETHDIPGDHITMMTEPYIQVLAKQLKACLDKSSS